MFCTRSITVGLAPAGFGRMKLAAMYGIIHTAYNILHDRAMKIAHGKSLMKSASGPVISPSIGKNIPEIEVVAMSIGTNRSCVDTAAEYQRECPFSSSSL